MLLVFPNFRNRANAAVHRADRFRYDPQQPAAYTEFLSALRRVADEIDACLAAHLHKLPPILFFTEHRSR